VVIASIDWIAFGLALGGLALSLYTGVVHGVLTRPWLSVRLELDRRHGDLYTGRFGDGVEHLVRCRVWNRRLAVAAREVEVLYVGGEW
jgi:hypothetical protein